MINNKTIMCRSLSPWGLRDMDIIRELMIKNQGVIKKSKDMHGEI
jgi:hypothetical protein